MNIRKSMLIKNSLIIVVPFMIFSLILLHIYNVQLNRVIGESLQSVARAQTATLSAFCEEQMNTLQQVGDTDVARAALRGELNDEVLSYLENMLFTSVNRADSLENMALISTDYRVVASSENGEVQNVDLGIESLIAALGTNTFYISDVCQYELNGQERKVVVALMQIKEEGKTVGYMIAEINLEFYTKLREQADFWKDSTFYLLDGTNSIISAGTSEEQRTEFITTEADRQDYERKYKAIDREAHLSGSFTYKVSGKDYVTYYSDVEYTQWELLITVNMDDYSAHSIIYIVILVSTVVMGIIVPIWLGIFTAKRIVRPVTRISDTLEQIREEKDYTLRVAIIREDEIGVLGKEINKLLHFLQMENFQRMQQQKLLQQRADHDALTKVLNKERITQYIEEAVHKHQKERTKAAVVFLDIDDFKAFNTLYGHNVGDQVLLFVASILKRETKGTVGRAGGDEFVAIVEDPDVLADLEECLKRIERRAESNFVIRNKGEHISICFCIGVVSVDFTKEFGESVIVKDLLDLADKAMYEVKHNGKHGYIVKEYEMKAMKND